MTNISPDDFSDSAPSALQSLSQSSGFDISSVVDFIAQGFIYIADSAFFTILIIALLILAGCLWLWKIIKEKLGIGKKKRLKDARDAADKSSAKDKAAKKAKDAAEEKRKKQRRAEERAAERRLEEQEKEKTEREEQEKVKEQKNEEEKEKQRQEKEAEDKKEQEAKEKEKENEKEKTDRQDSSKSSWTRIDSDSGYALDWNNRDGGMAAVQQTAGAMRAEDIAALFCGGAAKLEVASMLASILQMKAQGMDNSQIARVLANTKLLNPNIDCDSLSLAAGFYMNALEESSLDAEVARYNATKKQFAFEYDLPEVTKALNEGNTDKLTQSLADFAAFNAKQAAKMEEGLLREEMLAKASFASYASGLIKSSFDYDEARTDLGKAIEYVPSNFAAINYMAKIDMDRGYTQLAEQGFMLTAAKAKGKDYAKEYAFAEKYLGDIYLLKEHIKTDKEFASYIDMLSAIRTETRISIYSFIKGRQQQHIAMT